MSWLEIDDRILEHQKFIRAVKQGGSEAVHLWLGLRAYCGQHLTDGFIPDDVLDEVRGPTDPEKRKKALSALKAAGLLDAADGGVFLHDYYPVVARRDAARARKRADVEAQLEAIASRKEDRRGG